MSVNSATSFSDWYLVQLRPNQQERAARNLERQGYAWFNPSRPVTRRHRGKLVTGLGPVFPGYMFVRLGPAQEWRPINATYGVVRLVMRRPDMPQPVPEAVMADLRAGTDADGVLRPPADLAPGTPVRIAAGPMAGFTATVSRLGSADRVGVLLEVMGQAVRAELPRAHLDRLAG